MGRVCYFPKAGFDRNPILETVGPNDPCPCESGTKFKKCCKALLSPIVTREEAELTRRQLEREGYEPPRLSHQR
jgi:hypothetical protein